jgi:hypothetical protein
MKREKSSQSTFDKNESRPMDNCIHAISFRVTLCQGKGKEERGEGREERCFFALPDKKKKVVSTLFC